MIWLFGVIGLVVLLIVVFAFLHNTDPVERSPKEISNILEQWLNDKIDWHEWDYFESCDIDDAALNAIKNECMKIDRLDSKYLANPDEKLLN